MRYGRQRKYDGILDIPEGTSGDFSITHDVKPAGTELLSWNPRVALFGQRGESVTYAEPTRWHTLREGDGIWMTDLPIEQRQMDDLVRSASGRVLVGGLGLGYAVVALAAKPRVKEIVVVEKSRDVINLVWPWTVQRVADLQLPCQKLTIANADLFDYLKVTPDRYPWGLFDIWQGDGETTFHTMVVPLRKLAYGIVRRVECWNEDVMRGQLLQGISTRRHMLDAGAVFADMLSLDTLCDRKDRSIYTAWARPFWEWYRDYGRTSDRTVVTRVMATYAQSYGRPELDLNGYLDSMRRKSA